MASFAVFFGRLSYLSVILVSFYALFLALVLHPWIQAHSVYLHSINFPFQESLSNPERGKGLTAGRVRNFVIEASDGVQIAGWHLLPDNVDSAVPQQHSKVDVVFDVALREKSVLLYFHGNALNRAASFRIQAYKQFSALGINVIAIDYRGFGDSHGSPSEEGLQRDARAAYRWLRERQSKSIGDVKNDDLPPVFIAGHSLGTGVAARLTLDLVRVGHPPEILFLIAPYTSIRSLLTSYKMAGLLPIFWPLRVWKSLDTLVDKHLYTRFESDIAISQIITGGRTRLTSSEAGVYSHPDHSLSEGELLQELSLQTVTNGMSMPPSIIISHADDDGIIPHIHGRSLLQTMADALFQVEGRGRIAMVERSWGQEFSLEGFQGRRSFVLVKSRKGGHNGIPRHAMEIFGRTADGIYQEVKPHVQ
ncbi:hypothetical protein CBS101457_001859 [Exobasidium rhododendri]|nr:hypothetical protein CBS101457_001859 [Exobasidium rhododendri]